MAKAKGCYIKFEIGMHVHHECRRDFERKGDVGESVKVTPAKRRSQGQFDIDCQCIYCTRVIKEWQKKSGQTRDASSLSVFNKTVDIRNSVCSKDDRWTVLVVGRLN